jgi:hypothetical protein
MKFAILVLSDPKAGTEEAAGRVFNALAATRDLQLRHHEVNLMFLGTGTRWAPLLTREDHPFHALYTSVRGAIAGVSCACSEVFGARADVEASGHTLLTENAIPETSGLAGVAGLLEAGYQVLTF